MCPDCDYRPHRALSDPPIKFSTSCMCCLVSRYGIEPEEELPASPKRFSLSAWGGGPMNSMYHNDTEMTTIIGFCPGCNQQRQYRVNVSVARYTGKEEAQIWYNYYERIPAQRVPDCVTQTVSMLPQKEENLDYVRWKSTPLGLSVVPQPGAEFKLLQWITDTFSKTIGNISLWLVRRTALSDDYRPVSFEEVVEVIIRLTISISYLVSYEVFSLYHYLAGLPSPPRFLRNAMYLGITLVFARYLYRLVAAMDA